MEQEEWSLKTPQKIKVAGTIYEKVPEKIRVKGELYVLADAKHKKCKEGMHWNSKKKTCMRIPPLVASHIAKAHKASSVARSSNKKSLHQKASQLHRNAARLSKRHGFLGLYSRHMNASSRHGRKASQLHWSNFFGKKRNS